MLAYFLPFLLMTPLLVAGAIAFLYSQSLLSSLIVLAGAILGAILVVISGILGLQVLHRDWMASQASGFVFLPVILPFLAYTGAIAGTSLVAILYRYRHPDGIIFEDNVSSLVFYGVVITLTWILSGFIPSAIATFPKLAGLAQHERNQGSNQDSNQEHKLPSHLIMLPMLAICTGVTSAWLACELTYWLVTHISW